MSAGDPATGTQLLRERVLSEDCSVFGAWVSDPSFALLEAFSGSALDYIGIDCQHGISTEADVARLLASTESTGPPRIVRVSANRIELIGRALDGGADGVIIPTVDSATEAAEAVRAVRFPPHGVRSYGPTARFLPREPAALEQRALVLPMIETRAGVDAVEEIMAVPGVDGVYVGPADLGLSLGFDHRQFPVHEALEPVLHRIAEAARAAEKIAGIHAGSERFAARYVEIGFRLLTLGAPASFMVAGAKQVLESIGGSATLGEQSVSPY